MTYATRKLSPFYYSASSRGQWVLNVAGHNWWKRLEWLVTLRRRLPCCTKRRVWLRIFHLERFTYTIHNDFRAPRKILKMTGWTRKLSQSQLPLFGVDFELGRSTSVKHKVVVIVLLLWDQSSRVLTWKYVNARPISGMQPKSRNGWEFSESSTQRWLKPCSKS